jgi:hypothetical protein
MRGASASAAFQLLRGRNEDLSDGLNRRDVPALRVPNHLNKYGPNTGVFQNPIKRKQRYIILHNFDFPGCYLEIFIQIIGCVPSDRNQGPPWKPQICPEKTTLLYLGTLFRNSIISFEAP